MTIPIRLTPIEPDPLDELKALKQQQEPDPLDELKRMKATAAPDMTRTFAPQSTAVAPGQKERMAAQAKRPLLESVDLPFGVQKDLNQAAQGATFGFSDEAAAAFQSLLGQKYEDALKNERAGLAEFQREHPIRSFADQFAGGVATTGGVGGSAKAATTGARLLRSAATGTAAGAAYGAGTAEGDLESRAKGAAYGAVAGAALGTAVGLGVEGLLALKARAAARRASAADLKILEALKRDGMTVDDAIDAAKNFSDEKPAIVLDVGGRNTQRLGRAVHTSPSEGSEKLSAGLNERAKGTEERVINDLIETVGLGKRENAFKKAEDLVVERAKNAKPAYDAVRDIEVDDPGVLSLFDIPQFRALHGAIREAERIRPEGRRIRPISTTAVDENGVKTKTFNPQTLGTLDKMRQYAYELANGKQQSSKINQNTARAMYERLGEVTNRMDELYPEYAAAREGFKGDSKLMAAYEAGLEHFKKNPGESELLLSKMGDAEKELYRKGAREALTDRIESRAGNRDPGAIADKTLDQKRLRMLFGDDATYQEFQKRLGEETTMHRTRQMVQGNSQTVDKLAELSDMAGVPVEAVLQAGTGNVTGALRSIARTEIARRLMARMRGVNEKTANELADRMVQGTKSRQDLIDMLERVKAGQQKQLSPGPAKSLLPSAKQF